MMGLDNPIHLVFLLVILLLVFGAKRLPEMGRSLGAGLRGFKDSISGEETPGQLDHMTAASPTEQPAAQPVTDPTPVRPVA
jgi:sec-independent protein translocase protein TatA